MNLFSDFFHTIILKVSIFFDSLYKIDNKRIRILANVVYAIIVSFFIGVLLQLTLYIIIIPFMKLEVNSNELNYFIMPIAIFICFIEICILNIKDKKFSLPNKVLHIYFTLRKIKPFEGIGKILLFLTINSFIILLLLAWAFNPFIIPEKNFPILIFIFFTIAIFITMIIYSETTLEIILRKKRQFITSMLLFVGYLILNIYQISQTLQTNIDENSITLCAITILGLLLSIITVIDKARCLYETALDNYIEDINKELSEAYKKELEIVNSNKKAIGKQIIIIMSSWNLGKWYDRIKIIFYPIFIGILLIFLLIGFGKIEFALDFIYNWLVVTVLNGDENKAFIITTTLIIIGFITWLLYDCFHKFKESNYKYKLSFVVWMELSLFLLGICLMNLFTSIKESIYSFILVPLIYTFIFTLLLSYAFYIFIKLKSRK